MTLVMIVDDVAALAEQYAYDLRRLGGYDTVVATGGREALETLARDAVDCVILDLEMPGMDGFEVLTVLKARGVDTPVIVYTGTGNYDRCVRAVRLGAHGFIDKAEPMERVVQEVEHAVQRHRLQQEVRVLKRHLGQESPLIGASAAMQSLRDAIVRVAPVPSPVLVVGESGSGKELVARELHRLGSNPDGPFVAINSAALPDQLVESELFGHERGAFTGATAVRKGAFEAAGSGTLFLDEIGELPLGAQAKLLRVLEQRQVTRLGGNRTVTVEARVVAATNRDLESEVRAKRFRDDLYYRINVHTLRVPPLRDRLADVRELAGHLLAATCERFGVREKRLHPDALDRLMAYDWRRNNVRELRNIIERMVIAADGVEIGPEQVPPEIRTQDSGRRTGSGEAGQGPTYQALRSDAERRIVVAALERHGWKITETARELGLADHASLLKIMRRLGVSRD